MFDDNKKKYISWGVTVGVVGGACLLFSFILSRFEGISSAIKTITDILMPVIYGAVMAFLLAPVYDAAAKQLTGLFGGPGKKSQDEYHPLAKFIATMLSILLLLACVIAVIAMLLPQLIASVTDLFNTIQDNYGKIVVMIEEFFHGENEEAAEYLITIYNQLFQQLTEWFQTELMPNVNRILSGVTSGLLKILIFFKNFSIGIIIMSYLLNMKGTLAAQTKRLCYSFLPRRTANTLISDARFTRNVFSSFIVGKLIDSLIVGIICYVVMTFMNMPYTLLISVVVGVTNIIPFFGPFIGAIPSALILLIYSPMAMLQFCIFILILQQFDGNILGPKVLGQTTGVSSFWILVSILFFGGIWGIVGMIIGIPTFAVITRLVERLVRRLLDGKKLPTELEPYNGLISVEEGNVFMHKEVKTVPAAEEEDLHSEGK